MWTDFSFWDGLGIAGSLMICSAYLMVSTGKVRPAGIPYHTANAVGAILLLVSLWFRPNPGAILIEVLWLAIASFGIARALRARR